MIQAFRFIEISKYDDGGQLTTRGQLMQGSSTVTKSVVHGVNKVVTSSSFGVIQRHKATGGKWICHHPVTRLYTNLRRPIHITANCTFLM